MKKNQGITLIALVITIIILLILVGVAINFTLGERGIISLAKVAKNEYESSERNEINDLDKLYSSIKIANGSTITLTQEQLDEYINQKVEEKINSGNSSLMKNTVLWTGNISSGTLVLSDSIYNYHYLVFECMNGMSALVTVNRNGMTCIQGGSVYAQPKGNAATYWGFIVSSVSEDGKNLSLQRSGVGDASTSWGGSLSISKIIGI